MKHNILLIMKKEFARFFGDRRMLLPSLIAPGLLLYVIYSFMGGALANLENPGGTSEFYPAVHAVNLPASVRALTGAAGLTIAEEPPALGEDDFERVANKQVDLLIRFPADFDAQVAAYDVTSGQPAPLIEIYYNSATQLSISAYQTMRALLDDYHLSLSRKFDVNRGDGAWDLAKPGESIGDNIMAGLLPMIMMMLFFSSCIAIAPESIAGEKERGTIATLLVTPIKSWQLAAGKILSLALMTMLCGLSSALGAILGLGRMTEAAGGTFSLNLGGAQGYLLLLVVILSSTCLSIALIAITSAWSKTVKEANTNAMPLLLVGVMAGIFPLLMGGGGDWYYYLIPLYNGARCLGELFSLDYNLTGIAITVASNVVYACAGGFVLAKMFGSEKIIMTK